ncbi:exodeoxyribonuclease VII large subunit [Granulicoccus sp. GXG6511]|uniref:exodeoxyribonuclease VII large subunit n=1 Tax=Granulicoccus sp. GXG6511 TaxID=3381351 RepID=UPI003D7C7C4D
MQSSPESPQPLGKVVTAVKGWVERCGQVWVEGQLIELKRRQNSQWHWLTLRDRYAEVSASVSVPAEVLEAAGPVSAGMTVTCLLSPQVWTKTGSLSFACADLRPSGEGRLLAQLEQRKRQLQAEGLFDRALKKRLPVLPAAIGLITGAGSAAERDVVENVRRRWPGAVLEVRHTLVQGPQAAEQVMAALTSLDALEQVQVIVIARGGGSLEDLLPFSDEGLVRAVFAARTPVVSAIGHETDMPILDLVADLRASTPTDAAKRVVPDVAEEYVRVGQARDQMRRAVLGLVEREQHRLDQLRNRPCLIDPLYAFTLKHREIDDLHQRAGRAANALLDRETTGVRHALERIRAMSPKQTLDRGYAILLDGSGQAVSSVGQVDEGDGLQARLADGQLVVEVHEVTRADGRDAHEEWEDFDE